MVCITDEPLDFSSFDHGNDGERATLSQELARRCWGLLPGVHRLTLESGALQLTLCIASPLAHLREQDLAFDAIEVGQWPAGTEPGIWVAALARCSRRGTALSAVPTDAGFAAALQRAGFQLQEAHGTASKYSLQAQFDPPWQTGTRRPQRAALAAQPGRCTVVGAGLAGAACAASLARRGWQVTVLDRQGPAAGASGLPTGLMAPHVSPDDSPLSRLSRSGVRATLQAARQLLVEGRDWAPTGVLQRRLDGDAGALPRDWPEAGHAWSCEARQMPAALHEDAAWNSTLLDDALWHTSGAWIKPSQLIAAWLGQDGIALGCGMEVAQLKRLPDHTWQALDAHGETLAESELVILANAHRAHDLISPWLPDQGPRLQPVRGQVSWAMQAAGDKLPAVPVNGHGSLVSYPVEAGRAWLLGATFERDDTSDALRPQDHALTLAKLEELLPDTAASLAPRFASGQVQAWAGVRCSWRDHLPVVGPLSTELPGLWLCTGFGSRGLSYSAVCAELIAAWLHAEPLPMDARLAQQLHASRLMKPR